MSSWTRISYTSDSLSDNSLKHGVAGAGSDWDDGSAESLVVKVELKYSLNIIALLCGSCIAASLW